MTYRHGHWSADAQQCRHALAAGLPTLRGRFDLVIGSDLLYERDERGQLARFIGRHCTARAQVWIVDPDRSNRSAFTRHMAVQGFALYERRLDQPGTALAAPYKGRLLSYARGARDATG
jgi:hypothetical protein